MKQVDSASLLLFRVRRLSARLSPLFHGQLISHQSCSDMGTGGHFNKESLADVINGGSISNVITNPTCKYTKKKNQLEKIEAAKAA